MNRIDLQELAEERIQDAQALLTAGRWSGAYYLAGYAVECGLKACIAKKINQHDFPDRELTQKCYTHNLWSLVVVADLETQHKAELVRNPNFGRKWQIVKDWNEAARYRRWTELKAVELFEAVTDPNSGVLSWIKNHW